MLKKSIGNGGSKKAGGSPLAEFERVQAAHKAIEAMGVVLKDPDVGLLDFGTAGPTAQGLSVLALRRTGSGRPTGTSCTPDLPAASGCDWSAPAVFQNHLPLPGLGASPLPGSFFVV